MESITVPTTFTAAWIIVLAFVALIVQAIANQPGWSATGKRWATVGIAVLLGSIYMVATGAISVIPVDAQAVLVYWFIVIAGIIAVGQAVYGFMKPYLSKLEIVTSPDVLSTTAPAATESTTGSAESSADGSGDSSGGNDTGSTL